MTFVDSTVLMFEVFLRCRYAASDSGSLLDQLSPILEAVERERVFAVDVSPDHLNALPEWTVHLIQLPPGTDRLSIGVLSSRNQFLFSLIRTGSSEAKRLFSSGRRDALCAVGYALHVVPPLLVKPEQFHPKSYLGCFDRLGRHWGELSMEAQQIFCRAADLDSSAALATDQSLGRSSRGAASTTTAPGWGLTTDSTCARRTQQTIAGASKGVQLERALAE